MHVFLGPCLLTVSVVAFPELSLSINRSLKQLGYPFRLPLMHKSLNLGDPGVLLASLSQLYLLNFSMLFLPLLFPFLIFVKVWSAQSCLMLCNPWTAAHQAPLSMGFPRQEYWSGLPFPSPGYLPNPGIEPRSPTLQAVSLLSKPRGKPTARLLPVMISSFFFLLNEAD